MFTSCDDYSFTISATCSNSRQSQHYLSHNLVSVPDPKPTPAQIGLKYCDLIRHVYCFLRVVLEAIYAPDEVWGQDYSQPRSFPKTRGTLQLLGSQHNLFTLISI